MGNLAQADISHVRGPVLRVRGPVAFDEDVHQTLVEAYVPVSIDALMPGSIDSACTAVANAKSNVQNPSDASVWRDVPAVGSMPL